MRAYSIRWVVAAAAIVGLVASQAGAAVIVFDNFDGGGDGASIVERTPSGPNLPGGTWVRATNQDSLRTTHTAGYGNPLPGAFGNHQNASAISIASAGAYTKPTVLRISADIAPRNTAGAASAGRGVGLGFFSDVETGQQFSQNYFTGLVLDSAGNLNLVHDPNATGFYGSGSFLGEPIAFAGDWNANTLRRLSYDVDTATGAISNIGLQGSAATYSFTTSLFTGAATTYAGMNTSSGSGGTTGAFDNFRVEALGWLPAELGDDFAVLSSGSVTFDGDAEIGAGGTTIGVGAVEYLVVGGGGGGGSNRGGGGGAGGLLAGQMTVTGDTFDVTVGAGGAGGGGGSRGDGSPGQDSSFGSVVAVGGGRGVGNNHPGGDGGSGGGGDHVQNTAGGSGVPGQGHDGGAGDGGSGGGGGGAGAPGEAANATTTKGGDGGDGIQSSITGTPTWYAGGGGGGGRSAPFGAGGLGGGGDGAGESPSTTAAQAGMANTGGGGGGGTDSSRPGGAGGSGVVHIRYAGDGPVATGGTTAGPIASTPYTLHSYTNVGDSTFAVDQGIDLANQRATLTGNLSGAGGLTKTAPGTLVLGGSDNAYTGATTVREGTLLVNGALTGTSGVAVGSGTVYFDNFRGDDSDNLHGTQPVIGTGAWTASDHWKADGSRSTTGNGNAFLPFNPEAGKLYSLSIDLDPNEPSGSGDWFAVGFADSANTTSNFHHNDTAPWALLRANRTAGSNLQTFLGPSTGGGDTHDGPWPTGLVTMTVELDTRPDEWTAQWFVDGDLIRTTAFSANPSINYVSFGAYNSARGMVDNFQLDILHGLPTAVLGGTGAIHADTTIGRFGVLSPGDGEIGKLEFAGGARLTLDAGAAIDWQFLNESEEGTTYDHIVGDALYLPDGEGAISLNIFGLTGELGYSLSPGDRFTLFSGDVYDASTETLFDHGQDITHLFSITDDIDWWGTWEVTAGSLVLTAVPEPGTWLLLLSALAWGILVRRRKR